MTRLDPSNTSKLAVGGETDHGIPLTGNRARIMAETHNLYQLKPNRDFLKNTWREDAVFEDGVCYAKGYEQFAREWETTTLDVGDAGSVVS